MKKFNNLLAGLAVIALAASCSNEEPTGVTPLPGTEGTQTVMKVKIQGANTSSRANSTAAEGAYDFGTADEQAVNTADFFFFDADGIYVAQANLWTGKGEDNPSTNIDFKSESLLVLKGLTQKHAPKYLVTVLNADNSLANSMIIGTTTLNQFRDELTKDWNFSNTVNGKSYFVMSTTSFEGQDELGCTTLTDDDLVVLSGDETDITSDQIKDLHAVDVYVERLAAKYTLAANSSKKITITLAGYDNSSIGGPAAAEEVWVKIDGFGIVNAATKSYLVKHLTEEAPFTDWNKPADFRSFWAKSRFYNDVTTGTFGTTTLADVLANSDFAAVYSNEHTMPYTALQNSEANNRVNASLVTNVVFTATVTKDQAGTEPLDLVNYNGVFYKEEQFRNYVLSRLANTVGLNYYKKVEEGSTSTEVTEDKTVTTTTGAKYAQVGASDLVKVRRNANVKNAEMTYEVTPGIELYSYDAETKTCTKLDNGETALNNAIRSLFEAGNNVSNATANYPVSYTGGKTYYTVPVEHLVENTDMVVTQDGQYGIVRNHWYNFEVQKIMNMGEGVFNPDSVQDPDEITTTPDPKKEKYAMACKVNILSWKIVSQIIIL